MRPGLAVFTAVGLAVLGLAGPAAGQDCVGPVPDAEPGTATWEQREAGNVRCGTQRSTDLVANPVYAAALAQQLAGPSATRLQDPLRAVERHEGRRFRHDVTEFAGEGGAVRPAEVFRPCDPSCTDVPPRVARGDGPYPAVVVVHGGAANQEMYLWASELLAEAGYLVLTFQLPNDADTHTADLRKALAFLFSDGFPFRADLDAGRVGLAGHSAGGVAVSRVGQEDARVDAVVSWDRAQSTALPTDIPLRTPALYVAADFNCQAVPVCLPVRYAERPDPKGPGTKDQDFVRTAAAGVDTMKVTLRAATHLDFSVLPSGVGSRYGQAVTSYFTRAWFDRYVRGDAVAARRLTAPAFDDSVDVHQLSGGELDPASGRNAGPLLAGLPVRDRLSFHFRSAWSFARGQLTCEDLRRGGCATVGPATPTRTTACRSRRRVLVTLPRLRAGEGVRQVTVRLGAGAARAGRVRAGRKVSVDLRGRARTRVAVTIRVRTTRGRTVTVRRAFRTCAPGR